MTYEIGFNLSKDVQVVVHNNGETGFAYYTLPDGIRGYIWLFNVAESPETYVQNDPEEPPLNPRPMIKPVAFKIPTEEEIGVDWFEESRGFAAIYVRGQLHAIVGDGTVPGWCILSAEPSELAQVLILSEDRNPNPPRYARYRFQIGSEGIQN